MSYFSKACLLFPKLLKYLCPKPLYPDAPSSSSQLDSFGQGAQNDAAVWDLDTQNKSFPQVKPTL